MAKKLQFYRGPKGSIPTLSPGEPGWVTDENRLYVGTGSENVGIPNMEDLNQVGSFYVEVTGSDETYTSDHSAQEIYEAYQADKAVFAKIGENIIPLTHVSLSGSTYSAQFNVFSGIEGYQGILITQSGETKHVYVTDNQPSADGVSYNNGTSGLAATDMQSAVDEVAGKFGNFIPSSQKGVSGGVATLDDTGKLTETQKPAYTATEVGARPSTWTPSAEDVGAIAATEKGANNGVATLDETGKLSSSQKPTYTATEVGARPSTWTPSAEDVGAIAATEKGANNGVAELDGNGKVPAAQLPSYVDDVVDAYVVGGTPYAQDWLSAESGGAALTPEGSKIYLVVSEGEYQNREYRWSGTQYAQISEGLALGETQDTAFRGDHGKTAYEHSQLTSGNPHHVTAGDVGLGNVDNTSDTDKPVSTAQQTALDLKQNKLTGSSGQYVGFNSSGEAIAVDPPSSLPEGGSEGKLLGYGTEPEWVDSPVFNIEISLDSTNEVTSCNKTAQEIVEASEAGKEINAWLIFSDAASSANIYNRPIQLVLAQAMTRSGTTTYTVRFWSDSQYIDCMVLGVQQGTGETQWTLTDNSKQVIARPFQVTVPTSAWSSDTTYTSLGFNYRASVSVSDVTTSYIPDINFSPADQYSGNLASFADTYNGGVYIYAKTKPTETVTIESAIFTRS